MKFIRIISVALVGVVLLAGFASVTNALVVKPIRLHFALASGCKTINTAGILTGDSSNDLRNKVAKAFISAAHIDTSYLPLAQAAVVVGYTQGKNGLNDSMNGKAFDAVVLTAAFCG